MKDVSTTETPPIAAQVQYQWREEADGTFTVLNLPVFSTLAANAHGHNPEITEDWLKAAKARFGARKAEGYLPPMHLRHHRFDVAQRAGHFELIRLGRHKVDGSYLPTLFANLIRVPADRFAEMRRGEWPYRSVEIHDYSAPEIDSLALLDSEVPFFRYPCMGLSDQGSQFQVSNNYSDHPLRAVAAHGKARAFLFRSTGGLFMDSQDTGTGADPEGEGEGASGIDLDELAAKLEAMLVEKVVASVMERMGGKMGDDDAEETEEEGGQMSAQSPAGDDSAALAARLTHLEDNEEKRAAADRTRDRIDGAFGGPLKSANLGTKGRERVEKFAASMSDSDWSEYVDQLATTVVRDDDDTLGDLFGSGESAQPSEVAQFSSDPKKYEIAKRVASEYAARKAAGLASGYTLEWKINREIRRAGLAQ